MVRVSKRLLAALGCLAALALGGCGGGEPVRRERFYSLDPVVQVSPVPRRFNGTLLVQPVAARGFVGGTQIVFRTADEPLRAQRYDDYLWEETPPHALSSALTKALRRSGMLEFVITPAQRARSDWILTGELQRMEHLPKANPPSVAMRFKLLIIDGNTRRPLLSSDYAGIEPVSGASPGDMASAFNRLAGRLIEQVVADLAKLRAKP